MEVETDGGKVFGLPAVSSFLRRIKLKTRIKKKRKKISWRASNLRWSIIHEMTSKWFVTGAKQPQDSLAINQRASASVVTMGAGSISEKRKLAKRLFILLSFFLLLSNNTASGTHRKHNRVFPSQRHPAEEGREHLSAPTSGFEKCGLSRSRFYLRISPSAAPTHLTDLQKYELIKACL